MTPLPARKQDPNRAESAGPSVVRRIEDLRAALRPWREAGERIALVPTMGALHAGHMALVHQAQAECDRTVVTLFVNRLQFNNRSDLASYPQDEARDGAMLADAGVAMLFAPNEAEMYPEGFSTTVSVAGLTDCLCGRTRPGHMSGVATAVTKLLVQALPDVAYFGEKDYQQLLVVRRLVRDLDLPVRIGAVATVRDDDGLAYSSRNACLTADQRHRAPMLYQVLQSVAGRLIAGGDTAAELARGREALLRGGFDRIDYFELRNGHTLAALKHAEPPARLFAAGWLGSTRLIDNVSVC